MANTIWVIEDATIRIYEQSEDSSLSAVRGSSLTTGLLYVTSLRLTRRTDYQPNPQHGQGSGRERQTPMGQEHRLSWETTAYQYSSDYGIAIDPHSNYWIEVEFEDLSAPSQQTETHPLKYCKPADGEIAGSSDGNTVSRSWIVGEVGDVTETNA